MSTEVKKIAINYNNVVLVCYSATENISVIHLVSGQKVQQVGDGAYGDFMTYMEHLESAIRLKNDQGSVVVSLRSLDAAYMAAGGDHYVVVKGLSIPVDSRSYEQAIEALVRPFK